MDAELNCLYFLLFTARGDIKRSQFLGDHAPQTRSVSSRSGSTRVARRARRADGRAQRAAGACARRAAQARAQARGRHRADEGGRALGADVIKKR